MKKKFKRFIIIIILISIGIFLYKYLIAPHDNFRSINMVPENSFMIIETNNPFKTWKKLDQSAIWKHMQTNYFFKKINNEMYSTDSLLRKNKLLFRFLGSRNVLLSIHHMDKNKYSMLIVADLKNLSKLKGLKNYFTTLNNNDYNISKREYLKYEIYEVYDRENREMIYVSFVENLIVISYDYLLLEKSLKQADLPILARDQNFVEISNQIHGSGQIRFYLNFKEINKLLKLYDNSSRDSFNSFLQLLYFGGLKLDIEDDLFNLNGYLNGTDTIPTLINALSGTGNGGNEMFDYIPKRTFLMIHLSFGSFNVLLQNLEDNLKRENMFEEYDKSRKKIERLLNIDINGNIISWIGDEIGILNIKSKYKNIPPEYVLVIKSKNKDKSKQNLQYINDQIRKNTPVKFNSTTYKGTDINYLLATGLFKIFFGKLFSKLDKPYYMTIDNYVYFSNHPQTLKDIIDDLADEKTLLNWKEFETFRFKNFNNSSNIFLFINTPIFVNEFKNTQLKGYKYKIEKNKVFFDQLPFAGIQLDGKRDIFYSHVVIQYKDTLINNEIFNDLLPNKKNELPMKIEPLNPRSEFIIDNKSTLDTTEIITDPFKIPDIAILDLSKKDHIEYYENNMIKIEVEVSGGIKNGNFTWYYPNGNEKLKGRYKNDKKTGTWKFYDENGKLIEKRKFE